VLQAVVVVTFFWVFVELVDEGANVALELNVRCDLSPSFWRRE
jgi:hypothetical protein